jgi:hypothetical protein
MLVHRTKLALAVIGLLTGFVPSAHGAFHFWQITQLYSNSSGTLQFIEMQTAAGGQNAVPGQSISVTNGTTNTFTIPPASPPLPGDTTNKFLLFGTAGIQAAGGPAPDYILPPNFLFTNGGIINYFSLIDPNNGTVPYPALPLNGLSSYNWQSGNTIVTNIAHNYSGGFGTVNGVPEPSTMILTSVGAGLFGWHRRRSRRKFAELCSNQS